MKHVSVSPTNGMDTIGLKVKIENEWFIAICSRCRQNIKFGAFTSLFCGVLYVKEIPMIFLLYGVVVAVNVVIA